MKEDNFIEIEELKLILYIIFFSILLVGLCLTNKRIVLNNSLASIIFIVISILGMFVTYKIRR